MLYLPKREIKKAWGEWIYDLADWDWYGTFTFRFPVSQEEANHVWRKGWLRPLEKSLNRQVHFVRVLENPYDNPHYHALLAGTSEAGIHEWEDEWYTLKGIAKIEPYNRELGGSWYISKDLYKDTEVVFSKNIQKARKNFSLN